MSTRPVLMLAPGPTIVPAGSFVYNRLKLGLFCKKRISSNVNNSSFLRKAEERTVEAVWKRIGSLFICFDPSERAAYFRNIMLQSKSQ